jgi:MoaD family protein
LRVKVEYLGHVRNYVDNKKVEEIEVEKDSSTVDLLLVLGKKYGESFKKSIYEPKGTDVKPNYIITVNGYLLNQLRGILTKLNEGDKVVILPIVSGG